MGQEARIRSCTFPLTSGIVERGLASRGILALVGFEVERGVLY
jgi:hypothetical protein